MISAHRSWPLVSALVGVLACGGGGGGGPTGPSTPTTPGGPSPSASVTMSSATDTYGSATNSFSPSSVSIARNGTVTWTNGTGVVHNVSFSGTGAPANIGDHSSGVNTRTFPAAGTFSYQCTNHPGMTGSVTVQ